MNNEKHMQVMVKKVFEGTEYFQTAWVPVDVIGTGFLKFKNDDGTWDEGWEIVQSYTGVTFPSKYIMERNQDYKKTRKASDI